MVLEHSRFSRRAQQIATSRTGLKNLLAEVLKSLRSCF